ncbi:unnamed protein product [Amoebophrya sp. A25]|nr:unnamed protein product [Amoebophrya sp. A25]|eukprot:GSA25T00010512001.1
MSAPYGNGWYSGYSWYNPAEKGSSSGATRAPTSSTTRPATSTASTTGVSATTSSAVGTATAASVALGGSTQGGATGSSSGSQQHLAATTSSASGSTNNLLTNGTSATAEQHHGGAGATTTSPSGAVASSSSTSNTSRTAEQQQAGASAYAKFWHDNPKFWHDKNLAWGTTHPSANVPIKIPNPDVRPTITDVQNLLARVLCPESYGRFSSTDAKHEVSFVEVPNSHKIPRVTLCLLPSLGFASASRRGEIKKGAAAAEQDGSRADLVELRKRNREGDLSKCYFMPWLSSIFRRSWLCHLSLKRGFFPERHELLREMLLGKLKVTRDGKVREPKIHPHLLGDRRVNGPTRDKTNILYPSHGFLATKDELALAQYPVLCCVNTMGLEHHLDAGWCCARKKGPEDLVPNMCDILTIDCEMVQTSAEENALARLSAVNFQGQVLLDIYVKPPNPVTDYKTQFSGITVSDLMGVSRTLEDAQNLLLRFLGPRTVLCGHSLENDLNALKLIHPFIIDTAILYPHPERLPMKRGLQWLVERMLKKKMDRDRGHNSVDDAVFTLQLVQLKIQNGLHYNHPSSQNEMEVLRTIGALPGVRTRLFSDQDALPERQSWAGKYGESLLLAIDNAVARLSTSRASPRLTASLRTTSKSAQAATASSAARTASKPVVATANASSKPAGTTAAANASLNSAGSTAAANGATTTTDSSVAGCPGSSMNGPNGVGAAGPSAASSVSGSTAANKRMGEDSGMSQQPEKRRRSGSPSTLRSAAAATAALAASASNKVVTKKTSGAGGEDQSTSSIVVGGIVATSTAKETANGAVEDEETPSRGGDETTRAADAGGDSAKRRRVDTPAGVGTNKDREQALAGTTENSTSSRINVAVAAPVPSSSSSSGEVDGSDAVADTSPVPDSPMDNDLGAALPTVAPLEGLLNQKDQASSQNKPQQRTTNMTSPDVLEEDSTGAPPPRATELSKRASALRKHLTDRRSSAMLSAPVDDGAPPAENNSSTTAAAAAAAAAAAGDTAIAANLLLGAGVLENGTTSKLLEGEMRASPDDSSSDDDDDDDDDQEDSLSDSTGESSSGRPEDKDSSSSTGKDQDSATGSGTTAKVTASGAPQSSRGTVTTGGAPAVASSSSIVTSGLGGAVKRLSGSGRSSGEKCIANAGTTVAAGGKTQSENLAEGDAAIQASPSKPVGALPTDAAIPAVTKRPAGKSAPPAQSTTSSSLTVGNSSGAGNISSGAIEGAGGNNKGGQNKALAGPQGAAAGSEGANNAAVSGTAAGQTTAQLRSSSKNSSPTLRTGAVRSKSGGTPPVPPGSNISNHNVTSTSSRTSRRTGADSQLLQAATEVEASWPAALPTGATKEKWKELRIFNFSRLETVDNSSNRVEENLHLMQLDDDLKELVERTGIRNEMFIFLSSGKASSYNRVVRAIARGQGADPKWEKLVGSMSNLRTQCNESGFLAIHLKGVDDVFLGRQMVPSQTGKTTSQTSQSLRMQ